MQSGVYIIKNLINQKIYIGSSANLKNRIKQHFSQLKRNKHCNIYLQRAFNKYGENNFNITILEYCKEQFLFSKEREYIEKYNSLATEKGYNMSLPPSDTEAGRKAQESIDKQKKYWDNNKPYNCNITEEQWKQYRKEGKYSFKGGWYTKEELKHIKLKNSRNTPIFVLDLDENILASYESIATAGLDLNISARKIWLVIQFHIQGSNKVKGYRYSHKSFIFQKQNPDYVWSRLKFRSAKTRGKSKK